MEKSFLSATWFGLSKHTCQVNVSCTATKVQINLPGLESFMRKTPYLILDLKDKK